MAVVQPNNAALQQAMEAQRAQQEVLTAQVAAMKVLQREARIRAEVQKHKSPQIKVRNLTTIFSISFLKFLLCTVSF